jgi:predicted GNAT family acetyltransferase
MDASTFVVRDDPGRLRYELFRDGEPVGELDYRFEDGVVLLAHTEVPPSLRGQGLASRLVAGALDDIRSRGLRIAPLCPFVAAYLSRHPEQGDLVV